MSTEKLFIIDPYNDEHLKLFDEFEKENNIPTKTSTYFKELRKKITRKEYEHQQKTSNEINQNLFFQHKDLKDSCAIQGERDIKLCNLSFAKLKKNIKNRPLLPLAIDYAFTVLAMEDIFITISTQDKNLKLNLEHSGFENLGEENGKITYLKEKENIKSIGRKVA